MTAVEDARMPRPATIVLTIGYVASILIATWAARFIVPVGFGYSAPAAVYVVGITLVLRDLLQRRIGAGPTMILILIGAGLSVLINPRIAVASAVAFLASETVDLIVYTALQRRGLYTAVIGSNAVSLIVDSVLFLSLAFGSLTYLPGQIIGKSVATLAAVAVLWALHRRPEPA